jgi:cell wall-associated NlpC family hydrolase
MSPTFRVRLLALPIGIAALGVAAVLAQASLHPASSPASSAASKVVDALPRPISSPAVHAAAAARPAERLAGPAVIPEPRAPAGPASVADSAPVQFAVSKPAGAFARPLPLFTDTTSVVPPEGLIITVSTVSTAPATTAAPTTTVAPTTTRAPKRAKTTPTTVTVAPTPTTVPAPVAAPPVLVPPGGLVIPAPGTPTTTPPTTAVPTTPPTTLGVIPLPVSTTPSTAASTLPTAAPTTVVVTTRPATTVPRSTTTTLALVPLPASTAPTTVPAAVSTPTATPPTTIVSATTAPRVGVGPRPTIVVRPVTEGRDAPPLPPGETPLPTAPPSSTEPKTFTFVGATGPAPARHPQADAAVAEAMSHVGTPYVWGGEGPDGFDCSGLSLVAWRAVGVALPHQSRSQFAQTVRINQADLAPGDLLFFGDPIHHLGIYIGDGKMVEAAKPGTNVKTSTIKRRDLVGIGRIIG